LHDQIHPIYDFGLDCTKQTVAIVSQFFLHYVLFGSRLKSQLILLFSLFLLLFISSTALFGTIH